MTKIRSINELQDALDKDMAWRIKELANIKSILSKSAKFEETIVRTGILILYSHWEGFVKNASIAYINFVSSKKLKAQDLTKNFITINCRVNLLSVISLLSPILTAVCKPCI